MGLVSRMEEESECIEAIFEDYIITRSKENIFCFFEGKDDYKYYMGRISYLINQETPPKQYVCHSKENVLEIFNMISEATKYSNTEIKMFFIDNDYDEEHIISSDIYITPCYSIENFYFTDTAIKRMLIGELSYSGEKEDSEKEDFRNAFLYIINKRDMFINSIIYTSAWYSLQQYFAKKSKPEKYPNLNKLKNSKDIMGITDITVLQQLTNNYLEIKKEQLEKEIEYQNESPVFRIRGKYLEQYMSKVIREVFQDANNKINRNIFKNYKKVNINVGEDNLISIFSQYAGTPMCLRDYLNIKLNLYSEAMVAAASEL